MKVNILGTDYKIHFRNIKSDTKLKQCDGYIDHSVKKIVVGIFEKDDMSIEDLESYQKKVLRHEIIHGFLYESGLWNNTNKSETWATSEEMTDWLAIQLPKIHKVFEKARCI